MDVEPSDPSRGEGGQKVQKTDVGASPGGAGGGGAIVQEGNMGTDDVTALVDR